jgi:hypothetical protein
VRRLTVFKNREYVDARGSDRRMEELHNVHSRRILWTGHVARMGEVRNYTFFFRKHEDHLENQA